MLGRRIATREMQEEPCMTVVKVEPLYRCGLHLDSYVATRRDCVSSCPGFEKPV